MLYDYCEARGITHRRCGKLIVATTPAQVSQLALIAHKAQHNGVNDLQYLSQAETAQLDPALRCQAALLSPATGIVDSHGLMLSLLGDVQNAAGTLALNSPLALISYAQGAIQLMTDDGTWLRARGLVNAAGLQAPALAHKFSGLAASHVPTAFFAKGNYFTLAGRVPFTHLVYPVPEPAGLGVHLTLDLGGQAKFGPDVQWVSSPEDLCVDPARGQAFYAEVRKYWPDLPDGALLPGYAGIRPKISGPEAPPADFMIDGPLDHGVPGLVNLFGIESPGLTSALAIGRHVSELI